MDLDRNPGNLNRILPVENFPRAIAEIVKASDKSRSNGNLIRGAHFLDYNGLYETSGLP